MSKFSIVLTGNRSIEIDLKQKVIVEEAWRQEGERKIQIGNNLIHTSTIRGIFEIKSDSQSMKSAGAISERIESEFDQDCKRISDLPIYRKVEKELMIRIFPKAFMQKGWIKQGVSAVRDEVEQLLLDFFTANPKYPRCPARFWFPIIKPYVNPLVAKYYEIVDRNDDAIYMWAKINQIKINESFQTSSGN